MDKTILRGTYFASLILCIRVTQGIVSALKPYIYIHWRNYANGNTKISKAKTGKQNVLAIVQLQTLLGNTMRSVLTRVITSLSSWSLYLQLSLTWAISSKHLERETGDTGLEKWVMRWVWSSQHVVLQFNLFPISPFKSLTCLYW